MIRGIEPLVQDKEPEQPDSSLVIQSRGAVRNTLPSAEKTASFDLTLFLFLLCEAAAVFVPIWTVRTFAYDGSIYFHSIGVLLLEPEFSTWLPVWFLVHVFFLPRGRCQS